MPFLLVQAATAATASVQAEALASAAAGNQATQDALASAANQAQAVNQALTLGALPAPSPVVEAAVAASAATHPAAIALGLATGNRSDWRNLLSQDAWRQLIAEALHALVEIALVGGLILIALSLWQRLVKRLMQLAHESLPGESRYRVAQRSETLAGMVGSLGKALIMFVGTMIILSRLGVNVAPILASAGILGVAVGFGSQSLVKDVITGFFILLEDQYGVGDSVEINGTAGEVERMNLRVTQLRDRQGRLISIPNGKVEVVVNASKGWGVASVEVAVDATVPPDVAIAALQASLVGMAEAHKGDLTGEVTVLGVENLGSGQATLKAQVHTLPGKERAVSRAMRQAVWSEMPKHGALPVGFPESLAEPPSPSAPGPQPSSEAQG